MANFTDMMTVAMECANAYSRLSRSKRTSVGAVLVRDGRIISVGYNGTPSGFPNECEGEDGLTLDSVVHAEANVILFAAKNGVKTDGATLVTTMAPCHECAKMIIQAGITQVIYRDHYRDDRGKQILHEARIHCSRKEV